MMMAASVAFGRKNSSGVRNIAASAMPTAVKAPAAGVSAPAWKFTIERERPPVTGKSARQARADVRGTQCDQFLVGIHALAAFGGERQGDRDGLHITHDGDQQCRNKECRPEPHLKRRQSELWQALGDGADDADAVVGKPKAPGSGGGRDDRHDRTDLYQDVGYPFAEPEAEQERL